MMKRPVVEKGDGVVFSSPVLEGSMQYDHARKMLSRDVIYIVKRVKLYASDAEVQLEGVPDLWFNLEFFETIKAVKEA